MVSYKVSIIIPIYRVEPYIVRCIESVLHQTYRNLEVILVDDCSPDRSMELAKECIGQSPFSKDLGFIYLKHEHNRGLSAARNTGIGAATGDYVFFLDSDDELVHDAICVLIENVCKYKSPEMVIGSIRCIDKEGHCFEQKFPDKLHVSNEIIRSVYLNKCIPEVAWNKLVRLDFLKSNQLFFVEGVIHEDNPWSFFTANLLDTIVMTSHITYLYYLRSNSIMGKLQNRKYKMLHFNSLLRIIQEYDDGFKKKKLICDIDNIKYYSILKYNFIQEVFMTSKIPWKYKLLCLYDLLKKKWAVAFIFISIELRIKALIKRCLFAIPFLFLSYKKIIVCDMDI